MIILTRDRSGTCGCCGQVVPKVIDLSLDRRAPTKLSACADCMRRMYEMALRANANDVERAEWP